LSRSDRVLWIRDGRVDRIQNRDELNIVVGELQRPAMAGSRGASS
jgi:putative ABC transport system ATP-binding protein